MADDVASGIRQAQVVLPCDDLSPSLSFFVERLGFRVDLIRPADDPRCALLSGHGLRLALDAGASGPAGHLRLSCAEPSALAGGDEELVAPNGTRIELVPESTPLVVPALEPSLVVTRFDDDASWVEGRAGMHYRDLVPDRQGGRFIVSHLRIEEGGPVPDWVHHHDVRFQVIHCLRGWVRVVYEDQGPPFVMEAGDCVLQPPGIRHRVLECSPGVEVVELGCPAEHDTLADHELELPTTTLRPERDFGGQRFVLSRASEASWQAWHRPGFECRDTGIAAATDGLATVRVVRPQGEPDAERWSHEGELLFFFVLEGRASLDLGKPESLAAGDAVVVPAGLEHAFTDVSPDLELLEIALPAADVR
ncbi:MAG: cupin domain-containing protein [Acidobacteriota bacterium]